MGKSMIGMKLNDWSLNLEDPYYEEHPEEILPESMKAIEQTSTGCYVNIVTPGLYGDPREQFIAQLQKQIASQQIAVKEVRFIDECGCGGFVTRVFR